MAEGTIQGYTKIVTGTLATYTWGTVTYVHDELNQICYVRFKGNSNRSPDNTITSISLPSNLRPKSSSIAMLFPLYGGGFIEYSDNAINLRTNNTTWQAGSLVYITV